MDPFSAEGELLNIHNAFHQGQYETVIDFDTASLSSENKTPARILQLRVQIANGQAKEVLSSIKKEGDAPDFTAVKALAQYTSGSTSAAVSEIEKLAEKHSENAAVQSLGGTVLQSAGKTDEALSLLSKHQGSLEAIALIVQIHLQQNRNDLALKEVQAARKWAQDSLLVNIAESWVGMRLVHSSYHPLVRTPNLPLTPFQGGDRYQSAFYVFEEMAQTPASSGTATKSLVSQAIAELHLGRLPEAEAALQQAVKQDPTDVEAIANSIVLNVVMGKEKDAEGLRESLRDVAPDHAFLVDLREKSEMFDQAATRYSAKVAS
ncbi:coatomer subunit epsilon, partial [Lecanoromycetidae sp. Uapishka_2]